jgi:RNA polymerase sigma-70 factor (sigma-E family)
MSVNEDDERDFREFVNARFESLRGLAYLTCGDWEAAEDAVSISLAKLYVRWHKVDSPHSYACRTVVRAAIDEARHPWRREHAASHRLPDRPMPDAAERIGERMRLRDALRQIPPGQRAILVLRFYEGLSVEQTAAALGLRTGTIKSQTARGLATLREVLAREGLAVPYATTDREDSHDIRASRVAGGGDRRRAATAYQR